MTLFQILAVALIGPLGLFAFAKFLFAVVFKNAQYTLADAIVFCVALAVILVAFLRVK